MNRLGFPGFGTAYFGADPGLVDITGAPAALDHTPAVTYKAPRRGAMRRRLYRWWNPRIQVVEEGPPEAVPEDAEQVQEAPAPPAPVARWPWARILGVVALVVVLAKLLRKK